MRGLLAPILAPLAAIMSVQSTPAYHFDPSEVDWATRPGNSVVQGRPIFGFDGNQNLCTEAILVPFSAYDEVVLKYWYGENLNQVSQFGEGVPEKHYALEYPMIQDKTNRKLWINQLRFKQKCDPSGYARFSNIPAGKYSLTLRYIRGYKTVYRAPYVTDRMPHGFSIVRLIEVPPNSTVDFDASGQMKR